MKSGILLKTAGVGLLGLVLQNSMPAQNTIRYPLTSKPNGVTEIDQARASKARKLAEYVITKDKHPGIIYHEDIPTTNPNYQIVEASMKIDESVYAVFVLNGNENVSQGYVLNINKKEVSIPFPLFPDSISIEVMPNGTKDKNFTTSFFDTGLVGMCSSAHLAPGLGTNGEGVDYPFHFQNIKSDARDDIVQKAYQRTLDTLMGFYEK